MAWLRLSCVLAAVLALWLLHRRRLRQLADQLNVRFEERLAERTRIAQQLYDTLLQGVLGACLQLHLAVDRLPGDSPHRVDLDRVLRAMGEATDEGRRVLQGLRCSEEGAESLEASLSRIPGELGMADTVSLRTTVVGEVRRVHPIIRDEVYRIGREALVGALCRSHARAIEVTVEYAARTLRLRIGDDGGGGGNRERQDANGTEGRGLAGMRQLAERMGARLRVRSGGGAGTEVELTVPGAIAFRAVASGVPARERPV